MDWPLVLQLLVATAHDVAADPGLEQGDDFGETLVTHVLKLTQDTSTEEDLGVAQTVFILVQLKGSQNLLSDDLAVDEALRHCIGSQDGVTVEGKCGGWNVNLTQMIATRWDVLLYGVKQGNHLSPVFL